MNHQTIQNDNLYTRMRNRNRSGTGINQVLQPKFAPTHYQDSLQRFQRDFAKYDQLKRQQEVYRKKTDIERRRVKTEQRQTYFHGQDEQKHIKLLQKFKESRTNQRNSLGNFPTKHKLGYNLITLQYEDNPQGQRLKTLQEDRQIQRYVRSDYIDHCNNCKYNPINGQKRMGIERIVNKQLNHRYMQNKEKFYDNLRLRIQDNKKPRNQAIFKYY